MADKHLSNRLKTGLFAIFLFTGSIALLPVHAQISDGGFYLGAGAGGTKFNGFDELCRDITGALPGLPVDTRCQSGETAFSWKLFAGWRFNPFLAVEGGYANLGKASGDTEIFGRDVNGEISASALFGELVGSLPLGQSGRLFGKLGLAELDAELTTDVFPVLLRVIPTQSFSESSTEMVFGLGAEYGFTQKLTGRFEWERFDYGDGIDLYSASIVIPLGKK